MVVILKQVQAPLTDTLSIFFCASHRRPSILSDAAGRTDGTVGQQRRLFRPRHSGARSPLDRRVLQRHREGKGEIIDRRRFSADSDSMTKQVRTLTSLVVRRRVAVICSIYIDVSGYGRRQPDTSEARHGLPVFVRAGRHPGGGADGRVRRQAFLEDARIDGRLSRSRYPPSAWIQMKYPSRAMRHFCLLSKLFFFIFKREYIMATDNGTDLNFNDGQ